MSSNHKASREAYAREHGLIADTMSERVRHRRNTAARYAYNARWNRLFETNATMYTYTGLFNVEPFGIKGVFLWSDVWELSPEESDAVEKAFQTRNKPTIPVNPCKEITFEDAEEALKRGYPVAVMPDGKVAVDTENQGMVFDTVLKPEEAEVLASLKSKRSKVPATENCEHRDICPGPCKHCDDPVARSEVVYKNGNIWHWAD